MYPIGYSIENKLQIRCDGENLRVSLFGNGR